MSNQHNNQHNNHQPHQQQLSEGLEAGDLARLVDPVFTVDEYKSKIGKDDEILVITFRIQGRDPALDLVSFVEKSYDWVLDADASSGELDDGTYLVFVEIDREPSVAEGIDQMIQDIENLTSIPPEEWQFVCHKPRRQAAYTKEEFINLVPLTPDAYLDKQRSENQVLDNLRTAAGVRVETRAPKNDFTESLRIAAGIR